MLAFQTKTANMQTVKKVYNLIILDESGSMESIKQATLNGFNELIQSIKHSEKLDHEIGQFIQFYTFNGGGIKEQFKLAPAHYIKTLSGKAYQPDNMTPLYDAIGYGVNSLRKAIKEEKDYNVLVTILTDGEENASTEYTFEAIAAMIISLNKEGWVFTYIGANHEVEKTAISLNINNHLLFEATAEETKAMFKKNTSSRQRYMDKIRRGDTDLQSDFFKEDDK